MQTRSQSKKRKRDTDHLESVDKAARIIQKFYSAHVKPLANSTDLMMEPFNRREPFGRREPFNRREPAGSIFRVCTDARQVYRFCPLQLRDAIVTTGKFVNPYTQFPLNVVELKRLCRAIKVLEPSYDLPLYEKETQETIQAQVKDRHENTVAIDHYKSVVDLIINSAYVCSDCSPFIPFAIQTFEMRHTEFSHLLAVFYNSYPAECATHIQSHLKRLRSAKKQCPWLSPIVTLYVNLLKLYAI